ncbi:MAG: hypothetical protein J6O61_09495 [Butyrivibrio sp.]|uniref:hypothetical protein n=1 Tax=Butyrivibrio sp. TaxID=28121 RepID=UPI001B283084|nr:hypothetical protein [Butyrivibrio sp.]MBO6241043.1 hypothetical protein [Butyrivibrio sp.]
MEGVDNKEQNTTENVTSDQVLIEIRDLTKKKLFFQRISTFCVAVMAVCVLVSVLIVIPKVRITLNHINDTAIQAQASLNEANTMISSITKASENLNSLVDENGEGLTNAVKALSEIDFEGLNEAIKDLQDAVGPLASFMSRFK